MNQAGVTSLICIWIDVLMLECWSLQDVVVIESHSLALSMNVHLPKKKKTFFPYRRKGAAVKQLQSSQKFEFDPFGPINIDPRYIWPTPPENRSAKWLNNVMKLIVVENQQKANLLEFFVVWPVTNFHNYEWVTVESRFYKSMGSLFKSSCVLEGILGGMSKQPQRSQRPGYDPSVRRL